MTDPITRLNAALEGRYRLAREIGEGGMATVYLADDLKHERKVALKVLKPELAAVVGAERFLAEIKTTANLQHPHILPLHASGEADGFLFYVMPYVEGESLRERLEREKQFPVDEAVQIAKNVAEALAYAHDKGVIHRDIKPANILLLQGKPVLSDFGIALAVGAAGGGRLTETGLSLGTPHYMSPEQATGDTSVGPGTDVYALGCVLYEMLVGEPPYTGSTPQAILGKIVTEPPAQVSKQRRSVPLNVEATIAKALEKVPADRFASAADFAKALGDGGFRHGVAVGSAVADSAAAGRWKLVAQAMTGVAAALALVAGWSLLRPEPPPLVARFESPFREGQAPIGLWETTPDGSAVVYVGPGSGGSGSQLWIRDWNALDARPIEGTEGVSTRLGATQLAVSPDGQEVAFSMGDPGPLRVVSLAGGPGRTLAEGTYGAAWSDDGWIYVTGSTVIERVRQTGGEAEAVTQLAEGESYHGLTQPLPGGKALLFTVWRLPETEIWSLDLGTGERKRVTTGSNPRYLPSGYLLFGTSDGALMAAPFDARRTELTRTAVPVLQGVARAPIDGNVVYTVSRNGTLLYLRGGSPHYEFVRVSRTGVVTPAAPGYAFEIPANGYSLRLSLDGTRVVFNRQVDGNGDVWIKTLSDGPEERITFDEAVDYRPLWAPDGETVTYFSGTTAAGVRVYSKRADGTGQPLLLLDDGRSFNQGSWSPDGTWLVVRTSAPEQEGGGPRDILAFRPGLDSIAVPLMASPEYDEQDPALSPDGAWLAYTSNETGRPEVYVRSYPNVDSTRVRVSTDGGFQPVWAKDGHELYFVSGGAPKQMMAARLDVASGRVTGRQALFDMPPTSLLVNAGNNSYDVSADGEWFLMARDVGGVADEVILVLNFFEELKRLVPN